MARLRVRVDDPLAKPPDLPLRKVVEENGKAEEAPVSVPPALVPRERLVGNWLNAYLEYTANSESPETYHVWSGLSALSSVTRRNTWLDQGLYVLFPNLYIALVGPPARTAKSTAIYMARKLLSQVPSVNFGPSAASREQLIRKMAETKFNNQCCLTVHSSEFSSILDVSGLLMIQFLTDIYDCSYVDKAGWTYETKNKGKDTIINPYLNLLVGTTPTYIATSMPDNLVGHGFTSRVIFINEEKERNIIPRPDALNPVLEKALIEDLKHIGNVYGQFNWSHDGEKAYDEYYHNLYKDIPQDYRLEGYHWRKKTHVLKVAMLLSLAENDTLTITAREIQTAARLLQDIEPNMSRTFSAVGKYEHAVDIERIGNMIREAGGMSMEEVFRRTYYVASEDELRRILNTLHKMGVISLQLVKGKEMAMPGGQNTPWRPNG